MADQADTITKAQGLTLAVALRAVLKDQLHAGRGFFEQQDGEPEPEEMVADLEAMILELRE